MSNNQTVSAMKVAFTKYDGSEMVKTSNTRANSDINIGQVHMLGVDGMRTSQIPPELLQKIREALAVGLARNFIAKALGELQPNNTCEIKS